VARQVAEVNTPTCVELAKPRVRVRTRATRHYTVRMAGPLPLRLLFVCGRGRLRSPTAEAIFAGEGVETQSAGVSSDADTPLDPEAILWADVIVFMQPQHRAKATRRFAKQLRGKRSICLNIPDRYGYMDVELIQRLRESVPRSIPQLR